MKYECLSKAVGESVRESVAFRDSSENEYDKDLNLNFMHKKSLHKCFIFTKCSNANNVCIIIHNAILI